MTWYLANQEATLYALASLTGEYEKAKFISIYKPKTYVPVGHTYRIFSYCWLWNAQEKIP